MLKNADIIFDDQDKSVFAALREKDLFNERCFRFDIADPYGGDMQDYINTALDIEKP